jgi:hypothetical protein
VRSRARALIFIGAILSAVMLQTAPMPGQSRGSLGTPQNGIPVSRELLQKVQSAGSWPVIIGLRAPFTPEGQLLGVASLQAQRNEISAM